jgi:hypothetical protein
VYGFDSGVAGIGKVSGAAVFTRGANVAPGI